MSVGAASAVKWAVSFAIALWLLAGLPSAYAQDAVALKARHTQLQAALASNQFQRPIYLESSEASGSLEGHIYARLEQPFAVVGPALRGTDHWCDILILHLNIKSCLGSTGQAGETLSLHVGRKFDQPLGDAHRVDFVYRVAASQSGYQQVELSSEKGPMGTSHYRIMLEAVALDAQRSFLHLSYSYHYGIAARLSLQAYLATLGRNKVGFSIEKRDAKGQPVYIGGTRGVIERNTMRYYLAIEAFLGALSVPAPQRLEKRLNDWFTAIERYPVQLNEMERGDYLEMKRKEIQRQQAPGPVAMAKQGPPVR